MSGARRVAGPRPAPPCVHTAVMALDEFIDALSDDWDNLETWLSVSKIESRDHRSTSRRRALGAPRSATR